MPSKGLERAAIGAIGAVVVLLAGAVQAVGVPGQGTWQSTLLGRDIGGNPVAASSASAVFLYDSTLDITWLRDANYNPAQQAIWPMDWSTASAWASSLTVGTYRDWRLPAMIDTGSAGCDFSNAGGTDCGSNVQIKSGDPTKYEAGQTVYSEMAHLFYVTLGNTARCPPGDANCSVPQPDGGLTNTGSFQHMLTSVYWSGLEYGPTPASAWFFNASVGEQHDTVKTSQYFALAVRPGDVAAVPEAQTYALLVLGLTALALVRRPH